jgi:hypothetical protein
MFLSIYVSKCLWIETAMYLHKVIWPGRWHHLTAIGGLPEHGNYVYLEINVQALIMWIWRCTLEAMIRSTWRQWASECGDGLVEYDYAILEARMEQDWRHTSVLWLREDGEHQPNIDRSESQMQTSQTLCTTSPVLICTSRCSQATLELSNVLSDSARAFSGVPESACSYGGGFRMLPDLTYRRIKCWRYWDLSADPQETSRTAETTSLLCMRLGAIRSPELLLDNHKAFRLIIFVFATITRFGTS